MTGSLQYLSDLVLIAKTDRRVWSGAVFILAAVFVWLMTDSWRKVVEPVPDERTKVLTDPKELDRALVTGLQQQLKEGAEERQYLRDRMDRVRNQISADTQEIDWHVSTLVTKLDSMTNKVSNLADQIGQARLDGARADQRIQQAKTKKPKKAKPMEEEE